MTREARRIGAALNASLHLHLGNSTAALVPANEAALAWLESQELAPEMAFFLSLSLEELVTNCIKYGYDDTAEHTIEIELSVTDRRLTIVVIDDGHAFNPLEERLPDLGQPIENRPIGGLGLHLLREMADEMTYERRDKTNRVSLTKN